MPTHEFFAAVTDPASAWFRLPDPFAQAMAGRRPQGLYLRMEVWPHGSAWVAMVFGEGGAMYLDQGRATFVR